MNKIKNLLLTGMALILMQACGSSAKEAELPVRKSCNLERLYKDMPQNIRTDTPDLAFVNALCAGKVDEVAALFREIFLKRGGVLNDFLYLCNLKRQIEQL